MYKCAIVSIKAYAHVSQRHWGYVSQHPTSAHSLVTGFEARVLDQPADVEGVWRSAFSASSGLVLIEAVTDAQVPVLPPEVTAEQVSSLATAVKRT